VNNAVPGRTWLPKEFRRRNVTADAAIRRVVKDYQITDPEVLKRLAARPSRY
jgi:hypothetical protein